MTVRRIDLSHPFHETVRQMASAPSPAKALEAVTAGVVTALDFHVAAVSLLTSDARFEVVSVAGNDEARSALMGTSVALDEMERELLASESWGSLLFLPARALNGVTGGWVPGARDRHRGGDWDPEDTLRCPLLSAEGELIGLLAVDLPRDGRRPNAEQRESLQMYAELAGLALASARGTAELRERVRRHEAIASTQVAAQAQTGIRQPSAASLRTEVQRENGGGHLLGMLERVVDPAGRAIAADATWAHVFATSDMPAVTASTATDLGAAPPRELAESLEQLAHTAWADQTLLTAATAATRWISTAAAAPTTDKVEVADGKAGWVLRRMSEAGSPLATSSSAAEFIRTAGFDHLLLCPLGAETECVGYLIAGRRGLPWTAEDLDAASQLGRIVSHAVLSVRLVRREQLLVQRLQSLDRYKNNLISTVSHELRTPLTSIVGYLELLEDAVPALHTQAPYMAVMRRNIERMLALTDDLLTLEQQGGPSVQPGEVVDLHQLVQQTVAQLAPSASRKGVELRTDLEPGPIHLGGSRHDLDTIVSNLVSNGVKYTPSGGEVTVTLDCTQRFVRLVVSDTGIGISNADQGELFSEFFRSNNPAALALPGTGLGLSIVRRVTQRAGGSIRLVSALGQGSTFTVRLPLTHLSSRAAEPTPHHDIT